MKTIVIDKNQQSQENILNYLKNISNIDLIEAYENFSQIKDYTEVDLIIFDIDSKNIEILNQIQNLKNNHKNLNFIAISYEINSNLVNQTLKIGVNDFILKPILPNILETAVSKISTPKNSKAKTISIFSNKGGVGKTTLLTNLAWELNNKTNEKICIIDFSFNNENANAMLNVKQKYNLDYILKNISTLNKDFFLSLMNKYQDKEIYLLETEENKLSKNNYSPQNITKIINSLKNIFDYIIIDTTNITDEANISIFDNSDLILFVTLGNNSSIINCQKCCELFDKIGYSDDKIRIVINRYIDGQELSIDDMENILKRKVFHTLPNNYLTLIDSINQNQNVGEVNPQSNIAKKYSELAKKILEIDFTSLNSKTNKHGIFNLLKRMGEE